MELDAISLFREDLRDLILSKVDLLGVCEALNGCPSNLSIVKPILMFFLNVTYTKVLPLNVAREMVKVVLAVVESLFEDLKDDMLIQPSMRVRCPRP